MEKTGFEKGKNVLHFTRYVMVKTMWVWRSTSALTWTRLTTPDT
jgi:hypothetical protein